MTYHIDDSAMPLSDLHARLKATDLVPSHRPLLDGFTKKSGLLKKAGVKSVAELRLRLKTKKPLTLLSEDTGIAPDYLSLLRRVVQGFFPKPQPLKVFDWLPRTLLPKLAQIGISNTQQLFEATQPNANKLIKQTKLKKEYISELQALSDLSRIQWVSPTFARMLIAAGYSNAKMVAEANPETLSKKLETANKINKFVKTKIGLRDIKRLVTAAAYVPQ